MSIYILILTNLYDTLGPKSIWIRVSIGLFIGPLSKPNKYDTRIN